jgi:hypothetical protein
MEAKTEKLEVIEPNSKPDAKATYNAKVDALCDEWSASGKNLDPEFVRRLMDLQNEGIQVAEADLERARELMLSAVMLLVTAALENKVTNPLGCIQALSGATVFEFEASRALAEGFCRDHGIPAELAGLALMANSRYYKSEVAKLRAKASE